MYARAKWHLTVWYVCIIKWQILTHLIRGTVVATAQQLSVQTFMCAIMPPFATFFGLQFSILMPYSYFKTYKQNKQLSYLKTLGKIKTHWAQMRVAQGCTCIVVALLVHWELTWRVYWFLNIKSYNNFRNTNNSLK